MNVREIFERNRNVQATHCWNGFIRFGTPVLQLQSRKNSEDSVAATACAASQ